MTQFDSANAGQTLADTASGTSEQRKVLTRAVAIPYLPEWLKSPDSHISKKCCIKNIQTKSSCNFAQYYKTENTVVSSNVLAHFHRHCLIKCQSNFFPFCKTIKIPPHFF